MGRFDGRGAIVTGGALGIGGGCARRLAADGAGVLIVDIDEEAGASNVNRILEAGGRAEFMAGDVAQEAVAAEMVERTVSHFGRLDLLVPTAYGGRAGSAGGAAEVRPEEGHRGLDLPGGAL